MEHHVAYIVTFGSAWADRKGTLLVRCFVLRGGDIGTVTLPFIELLLSCFVVAVLWSLFISICFFLDEPKTNGFGTVTCVLPCKNIYAKHT